MATETDFLTRLSVKRLAELNKTRAKVEMLERRADAMAEAALERRRADLLAELQARVAALGPTLRDMSAHVAELKAYLQSVYDADLLGDSLLQQLAAEHCIGYTVRLLDLMSEPTKYTSQGAAGVLELASSTLAMFSNRAAGIQALLDAGAIPVMVKMLSPLFPTVVVVNTANAIGNLADTSSARLSFRAAGGVGALVRLLRPDVEAAAQTAAAAALSLLGARDLVIQDSVRYLGGIDHLVELLGSSDTYTAEVARYALQALRHGNTKNQAEIITSIRGSSTLVKDLRRLEAASDLLRFEEGTPVKARSRASSLISAPHTPAPSALRPTTPTIAAFSQVRNLLNDLEAIDSISQAASLSPRAGMTRPSTAAAYSSPSKNLAGSLLRSSLNTTPAKASPLFVKTHSPATRGLDLASASPTASIATGSDWQLGTLVELETEMLRKKHIARFTPDELESLLSEMGFDSLDLRGFKVQRIDGAALLEMSEDAMLVDLVLPRAKVRKLRALQKAAMLFDRIATLPRQGKISEIELRLYLAGQGGSSTEVNKIVKLFRTLVRTDKYDFVAFWDFVTSYDWIAQALRIYNIPA